MRRKNRNAWRKRQHDVNNSQLNYRANTHTIYEVNQQGIYEVNPQSIYEGNPQAIYEGNPQPIYEVNPQPIYEVIPQPVYEVNPQPVYEVNTQPVYEVNPQPVYEVNQQPVYQDNPQLINQDQIHVEKNDSDDKVAGYSESNTLIESNTGVSEDPQENNVREDTDEQILQGKSTGINSDQTSINIDKQPEIENDNVQGSAPSPNANDENVQNIIEKNVTNNEGNQEVTNEPTPASESKIVEESGQHENKQGDEEEGFQSQYAKDQDNSHNANNGDVDHEERSHTPELKPSDDKVQEKKHITLKRAPTRRSRRPSSPLEDGEIKEPHEKSSKKIVLKRHTTDDSNSDFIDKIIINRRSSGGDEKSEKKRRLSAEEKTHVLIARPIKPAKPVKLNRHFSSPENQDSVTPPRNHKLPWGKSGWLENISATTFKIDVDTIKVVCPTVEFLNESEVKLESIPKERTKSESDVTKKKVVEEEKTEDESEKEQSEEEDSTEEQKIVANPNIIALNRKISIVDDTAAKLRPPPSPAKNPPSEILFITNLVRPFTLKQLKELLERTGKIKEDGFWTDRIKSKCYVRYGTVEEAETTRNALHGVYWPIGNGKQLAIEYGTQEEMEKAKNPVPLPTIVPDKLPQKENREPEVLEVRRRDRDRERERVQVKEERRREPSDREWSKSKEEHRRKHSRSKSRSRERVRKHSRRSYTPEDFNRKKHHKKVDDVVPQKLMDDLFLKTKTTPSIYWQPLSPQEIATKQQQRLVRMEEHKRRIEENRSRFRERDTRGSFRRR